MYIETSGFHEGSSFTVQTLLEPHFFYTQVSDETEKNPTNLCNGMERFGLRRIDILEELIFYPGFMEDFYRSSYYSITYIYE